VGVKQISDAYLSDTPKLMRDIVGIEKFCVQNNLAQALAKSGFACGNSAGDSDCWHGLDRAQQCLPESGTKEKRLVN
jgi:hypothetical protein